MINNNSIITYGTLSNFLEKLRSLFLQKNNVDDSLVEDSPNPISSKAVLEKLESYYTKNEIDLKQSEASIVQIINWGADD